MTKFLLPIIDRKDWQYDCYVHLSHLPNPMPLMLVQFGYHKTRKGYGFGPNVRDHCLLHFTRSGKGKLESGEMEYEIGAGNIFAIFPNQITYYESDQEDPWEYFWLGFEGLWADEIMSRIGFKKDQIIATRIAQPDVVFSMLEEMLGIVRTDTHLCDYLLKMMSCMYKLLQVLCEETQPALPVKKRDSKGKLGHEYTRMIISIIETSFRENINVQEIANQMNVNRSYLTDLFKRDTGMSIRQYLTEYRLKRALIYLQENDRNIKNVAAECGFDDPLYFSRAFHKRFGMSPQQWRKQNRETQDKSE